MIDLVSIYRIAIRFDPQQSCDAHAPPCLPQGLVLLRALADADCELDPVAFAEVRARLRRVCCAPASPLARARSARAC